MTIPDSLQHQIEMFRETGRVVVLDPNGFTEPSFISMLVGLGVTPKSYDPFVDHISLEHLRKHFDRLHDAIAGTVSAMPDHTDYIARHVAAGAVPDLAV
jgi:tryptophan halogenase